MHILGKAENPEDQKPDPHKNKRPYNILRDYKPTGNKAIDGCASCIMWHQERQIALKAIHLKPLYYDWFRQGLEILLGRPLEDDELMQIYGVDIEKGSSFQKTALLPEQWVTIN